MYIEDKNFKNKNLYKLFLILKWRKKHVCIFKTKEIPRIQMHINKLLYQFLESTCMYWKQLMQLLVVLHMQDIKKTRTISAFHKKVERTKTTTTSVRLHIESFIVCTYCISHIPVENHKKFFEHTINDPVLVGTACKEKDRVWLLGEFNAHSMNWKYLELTIFAQLP